MELLAGVLKMRRMSAALQPLQVIRLVAKGFAPVVRVIGEAVRDHRRRRRKTPEE